MIRDLVPSPRESRRRCQTAPDLWQQQIPSIFGEFKHAEHRSHICPDDGSINIPVQFLSDIPHCILEESLMVLCIASCSDDIQECFQVSPCPPSPGEVLSCDDLVTGGISRTW